jgi:hypothetical protein
MAIVLSESLNALKAETGLLSKQLSEKKTLGFAAKAAQLEKRRRQRRLRKGLVRHSLKRKIKLAKKNINKRKLTLMKANRKRKRTMRVLKRRKR